jgi:hypothetical protein
MHDRKDGGIRADPQCECDDNHGRESGIPDQPAHAVNNVLSEMIEEISDIHLQRRPVCFPNSD